MSKYTGGVLYDSCQTSAENAHDDNTASQARAAVMQKDLLLDTARNIDSSAGLGLTVSRSWRLFPPADADSRLSRGRRPA